MSPGIWHEAVTSLRSHRQYFKASKVAQFSCNKGVFWFVEIKINKQINKRIVVQMSCKAVNVSEYLLFSWNYWHWKNLQRFYPLGSDIQYFTFSLFAGIASNPCIEFRKRYLPWTLLCCHQQLYKFLCSTVGQKQSKNHCFELMKYHCPISKFLPSFLVAC